MFSELVQKQIIEALDYYDVISTSLGLKLEDDLVKIYDSLKKHPRSLLQYQQAVSKS